MGQSLTIFFPCCNDAATIGSLVAGADIVAQEFTEDYEIIVVDDGSTDSSRELLANLEKQYDRLRVLSHDENLGYGAALKAGFQSARKDLVFYTDGDGQYDVFELRQLLPLMQEEVDVINGYKISRSDPLYRVISGKIYLFLMRFLFRFQVRDVDCDFRLFRREALDSIQLTSNSGVICLELVKKLERAKRRFVEVPVHHYFRIDGRSQFFRVSHLFKMALEVFKLWWSLMVLRDKETQAFARFGTRL